VHTLRAAGHMCGCRDELKQHTRNTIYAYAGFALGARTEGDYLPLHREHLPQVRPRVPAPIAPATRPLASHLNTRPRTC
jgi:hypothetical protein